MYKQIRVNISVPKNIPHIPKAHVGLRVRPHVSRREWVQRIARIRTALEVNLSQGHISHHTPVFVHTTVGVPAYLCLKLMPISYCIGRSAFRLFSQSFDKNLLLL